MLFHRRGLLWLVSAVRYTFLGNAIFHSAYHFLRGYSKKNHSNVSYLKLSFFILSFYHSGMYFNVKFKAKNKNMFVCPLPINSLKWCPLKSLTRWLELHGIICKLEL